MCAARTTSLSQSADFVAVDAVAVDVAAVVVEVVVSPVADEVVVSLVVVVVAAAVVAPAAAAASLAAVAVVVVSLAAAQALSPSARPSDFSLSGRFPVVLPPHAAPAASPGVPTVAPLSSLLLYFLLHRSPAPAAPRVVPLSSLLLRYYPLHYSPVEFLPSHNKGGL